ncbi:hypothetical protein DPMN_170676 [Dreissena polymorpha]|uniref:RNF31 C-terminal domain-containing protein n=1 Tax=Dreissena polymorpha TaxID=45954 RepID=A0A9D4DZU4_DREPO|nr:hypothetical protein DPMN_170676 [Dreissena polymorpha]
MVNCKSNPVVYLAIFSNHYKEYLVSLINKNKIDPIEIMDMDALKILIERDEKQMPPLNKNETEAAYRKRIEKVCLLFAIQ